MASKKNTLRAESKAEADPAVEPGKREENRAATHKAIFAAARTLFRRDGFDGVTMDAIAQAAGVSRRTLFRHVTNKEDLLFSRRMEQLETLRELLNTPPKTTAFTQVRDALLSLASDNMAQANLIVRERKIVDGSPTLRARDLEIDQLFEAEVAASLTSGLRGETAKRRAELVAGAIVAVVRVTLAQWLAGAAKGDLRAMGRDALTLVAKLTE